MPPRSYMVTATLLGVLVAASLPLTMGFSIILWYWLFLVAAFILVTGGVIKIAYGLGVSPWIGFALASPGFVWAANSLLGLTSYMSLPLGRTLSVAASLAFLASAAGALRLVETMSRPHAAFRIGYGLLAAYAIFVIGGAVASASGWSFTRSTPYATSTRVVGVAVALVKYGAVIGAAVLITTRRDVEPWAAAAISLISAYMIYNAIRPMFGVTFPGALMFWMQPVLMLVGAAAVWRMGSVLLEQARRESYARG
jgi:hypothetical protein